MFRRAFALPIGLLVASLVVTPVAAEEPPLETAPPAEVVAEQAADRVVVALHDAAEADEVAADHGLEVVEPVAPGTDAPVVVSTEGQSVAQVIAELETDPAVAYAEPDYEVSLTNEGAVAVSVNDPMTASQYSLDRMSVRSAWGHTTGGNGVVAVLDTGVQFSHADLAGRLLSGHDFANDDADAADDNGHGTWVAGIIAARVNDGYGIAGISWSDRILPVKIMNANGLGYTSWLASGIRWAADHDATVINMSVGGFPYSQSVADAVDYAWAKGVVLVGAAGNNRRQESYYPASYPGVISVSATQADDEFTNWSSYGPSVDVSAPGASVLTTNCAKARTDSCAYSGEYITISGTSFATPNVAGVVALIRARNPAWTPSQVVTQLYQTVDDLGYPGWDERYGRGRVNALRAVGGSAPTVPLASGDAHEPNNTMGQARLLTLGETSRPSIHPAGDVDWLAVDVPRAGRLTVTTTAVVDTVRVPKSSLPVDPIIELYAANGSLLLTVDDGDSAATDVANLDMSAAGRIFVRLRNWFPNGSTAAYSVIASYTDTVAPRAISLVPAPGATGVSRVLLASIGFDEPVNGVDGSSLRLLDAQGAAVPATVGYDVSSRQASLRPNAPLASGHTYAIEVTDGVRDGGGNAYTGGGWSFTTGQYSFLDTAASPFAAEIDWLAEVGITKGCTLDRFCPGNPVTREQMASFLARARNLPAASADYFWDDNGSGHQEDINRVAQAGITQGCSPGAFCPGNVVTREQMASFLARALNLPAASSDFFSDDNGSGHQADINRVAQAGITLGCAPGRYCPGSAVTREQMAAFLYRAFAP